MKDYRIVEVFRTLQGEGYWAGTPSVFVRFAGCNLWNGQLVDRLRDFDRTGGKCALFCDTDFVSNVRKMDIESLADAIVALATTDDGLIEHVVFTGGEPLLQLDSQLLELLRKRVPAFRLSVETNGTAEPRPKVLELLDWICLSPKTPIERLVLKRADELKVVVPAMDPLAFTEFDADYLFVQPEAQPSIDRVGVSWMASENMERAVDFCLAHPAWRLSLQTHKLLNIP